MSNSTTVSTSERTTANVIVSGLPAAPRWALKIGHRIAPMLAVAGTVALLWLIQSRTAARLGNESFATGYSLLAICILLMLLPLRKRLISKPLGRLAIWQRTHHYLGMLSIAVYLMHAGPFTSGGLETALAITFWGIALSGIVGWYVNRTSPRLLRAAGAHVLREDIPIQKKQLCERAYRIALAAAGKSDTASLADHYQSELSEFLFRPRSILYRLFPTGTKRRALLASLESVDRYLSDEGREQRKEMSGLVILKDNLDFQSAIQTRIRLWAYSHTLLIGAFLVFTIAHVLLAHQYSTHW